MPVEFPSAWWEFSVPPSGSGLCKTLSLVPRVLGLVGMPETASGPACFSVHLWSG